MKDDITCAEKYGPAMAILDQAEADAYLERCIVHTMRVLGVPRERAEAIERHNLGYFAGYYSDDTRERVERVFRCAHPIFGAIAERGPPSFEEVFRAGLERGAAIAKSRGTA